MWVCYRTSWTFPAHKLLHLPDGDFSIVFASSTEDVPILSRAECLNLVVVAMKLLQDLAGLCVHDVNLSLGRAAAHSTNPHLEGLQRD